MNLLRNLFLLLILAMLVLPVFGNEDSAFDFGADVEIGAESFIENGESVSYQMISLDPDIAFGNFGIGVALTFHYRFSGDDGNFDFRQEDWIPDSERTFIDIYLPILRYFRYGHKGDPLYGKIGYIDDGSLGNGFIMGNYSNTHFLPERKIVGLALDLDGNLFNFPYVGIETFVGNLAKMDVFGTRLFARPLVFLEIPVIKDLQIGMTAAFDTKPNAFENFLVVADADVSNVSMYGVDFRQPVVSNSIISLAVFGDIAFQNGTSGGLLGFGGNLFSFLTYGLNALFLGDNFVPFYFDSSYDLFRERKYQVYNGTSEIAGYEGWLASMGFTFADGMFVFNASIDGAFVQDPLTPYPHLLATILVGEGLIPGFSFDASYDKRDIETFSDFISAENAVIGANINYKTGPAVITLGYDLRYAPESADGWETTAKLSTSISLF
jgi:hypothetical protein